MNNRDQKLWQGLCVGGGRGETREIYLFGFFELTAEIAMVCPPPFQVRVVPPVELDRSLDGRVIGPGHRVRWRRRPPFSATAAAGRTGLGYGRRHGRDPRKVAVVVVMLLVMVVVVMVMHVQIGRRVQPRAGHGLVLGTAGLGRLHLDVSHLQRLVFEGGKHVVRVDHLVHLEPRRFLRFVRMMVVTVQTRRVHAAATAADPRTGHAVVRFEKIAHDRLLQVSGLDHMLVFHHQSL